MGARAGMGSMRTTVRLLLALVLLAMSASAGQGSFPIENDWPHPIGKLCVRLSTDPGSLRAFAPFVYRYPFGCYRRGRSSAILQ